MPLDTAALDALFVSVSNPNADLLMIGNYVPIALVVGLAVAFHRDWRAEKIAHRRAIAERRAAQRFYAEYGRTVYADRQAYRAWCNGYLCRRFKTDREQDQIAPTDVECEAFSWQLAYLPSARPV